MGLKVDKKFFLKTYFAVFLGSIKEKNFWAIFKIKCLFRIRKPILSFKICKIFFNLKQCRYLSIYVYSLIHKNVSESVQFCFCQIEKKKLPDWKMQKIVCVSATNIFSRVKINLYILGETTSENNCQNDENKRIWKIIFSSLFLCLNIFCCCKDS